MVHCVQESKSSLWLGDSMGEIAEVIRAQITQDLAGRETEFAF